MQVFCSLMTFNSDNVMENNCATANCVYATLRKEDI